MKLQPFISLGERFGRRPLVDCLRHLLDEQRKRLAQGCAARASDEEALAAECAERLAASVRPSLRAVFNLTGTVLHTNLGRALYPQGAVDAALVAMTRAVNLEYYIDGAGRGERDDHVAERLVKLTGAEAAVVVNNNAAAVFLALNTVALGREVPISRGELVEIGGSFRIPEIMASSGCVMREVGTTNRTHPRDYESAIGDHTAALMKVHASNYEVRGFTASVSAKALAKIARAKGLPLIEDLGSGTLVDLEELGLPHEPTPRESIAAGVDLVTFSGDKLLGGPQCGIVVGRRDLIDRMRRNPMKRALRLDKVRLAALEAVLALHGDTNRLGACLPTLRLLRRTAKDVSEQAARLLPSARAAVEACFEVDIAHCASQIGSGALPVETLPSAALRFIPRVGHAECSVNELAASFRALPVPVIGRIHAEALWLDLRCLDFDHEPEFTSQLQGLFAMGHH